MSRASWLLVPALGGLLCAVGTRPAGAAEDFAFFHENVMGTSLELRVRADSAHAAQAAEGRVLREIDRLAALFSGYDPTSEFRRWQAASPAPARVSPELFEVLRASDDWRTRSGGAFDPRVQVLTELWTRCATRDRTPTPDELAEVRARMARPAWRLDPAAGTAERLSDCPLTLNAIAKGYIVERAAEAAGGPDQGIGGVLLNVGGDLRVSGNTPRSIGIADPAADSENAEPLTLIEVRDRSVATSGDSQRGLRIRGHWYSHIFDPRTGLPAGGVASATVIAERGADADALATIFNVLTPEESLKLAGSVPGVECLIVAKDGRVTQSDGWRRFERPNPHARVLAVAQDSRSQPKQDAPKGAPGGGWGGQWELVVTLELNRPDGSPQGYRRPYVAVWVENQDGFPVRTIALWLSSRGAGPDQWLPDLKRWYRSDEERRQVDPTDLAHTISRPTRPPGRYKVVWDGKDDHGKPVARGVYTVYIEAAREHGTYQSIRKRVTLADTPFAEDLKGNVEIKSAAIEYRRTSPSK